MTIERATKSTESTRSDLMQGTREQREKKEWQQFVKNVEERARAMGGELRVYDVFDEQGKVKQEARRIKVYPMDRTDASQLSEAFKDEYVLQMMTTTQLDNMKDGKLINEGQEPRPDKAWVYRLNSGSENVRDGELFDCSYNQKRSRWEMFPS